MNVRAVFGVWVAFLLLIIVSGEVGAYCTDSDGDDFFSKGFTRSGTYDVTYDRCASNVVLDEQYCWEDSSGNFQATLKSFYCPIGCADGACKSTWTYCHYQSGINTVQLFEGGVYRTYSDICTGSSLSRYTCNGDGIGATKKVTTTICPFGCSNGNCNPPNTCTDTDGGKVTGIKGTASGVLSGGAYSETDKCLGGSVVEQYCHSDVRSNETIACDWGCLDGACKSPPEPSCADTDGDDPNRVGTVSGTGSDYKWYEHTDVCATKNSVTENVCVGTGPTSKTVYCEFGCSNGKCDQQTNSCSDSEGGRENTVKGVVTGTFGGNSYSTPDACSGEFLTEYYCAGNEVGSDVVRCAWGCSGGACNLPPADSCVDTEQGVSSSIRGVVSGYKNQQTYYFSDECDLGQEGLLKEWSCRSDTAIFQTLICEFGCSDGICTSAPPVSCIDSDGGGGGQVDVPGSISGFDGNKEYGESDRCMDGNTLKEFECQGSSGGSNTIYCGYGCAGGRCLPQPLTCSDSDGGPNDGIKGATSGYDGTGNFIHQDRCTGPYELQEYFCNGDGSSSKLVFCELGCQDGVCKTPEIPNYACSDSDGGTVKDVFGTVTGVGGQGTFTNVDECRGDGVLERYCFGTQAKSVLLGCAFGCSAGACLQTPVNTCTDADGGNDTFHAGETSGYVGGLWYVRADDCVTEQVLREFNCRNSLSISSEVTCSFGCSAGACNAVAVNACVDTDEGKSFNTKGRIEVVKDGEEYTRSDSCSGRVLTEYYCSGESQGSTSTTCVYGCSNGRCLDDPCAGVSCGYQETCVQGDCVAVEPVEDTGCNGWSGNCGPGKMCRNDVCVPIPEGCDDKWGLKCPADERCVNNRCERVSTFDLCSGVTCPIIGMSCNPNTGRCEAGTLGDTRTGRGGISSVASVGTPNLVVSGSAAWSGTDDRMATVEVRITNTGDGDVLIPFFVEIDGKGVLVGKEDGADSVLAAGSKREITIDMPRGDFNDGEVVVRVDPAGVLTETFLGDNVAVIPLESLIPEPKKIEGKGEAGVKEKMVAEAIEEPKRVICSEVCRASGYTVGRCTDRCRSTEREKRGDACVEEDVKCCCRFDGEITGEREVDITLRTGWNLVAFPSDELTGTTCRTKLVPFFRVENGYSGSLKEATELTGKTARALLQDGFWAYAEEGCTVKVRERPRSPAGERRFSSGWSIVPLPEEMEGVSLEALYPGCGIKRAYLWNSKSQNWIRWNSADAFERTQIQQAMVVRMGGAC